jgi:LEA14-like dessication related protein
MKLHWLKVFPILACLFLASGCNSGLKLSDVLVDVIDYRPTTSDTQAQLTLRFNNENVFSIAIAGVTSKLYLNGTYVGKVESQEAIGITQLGTINRDVVLLIENTAFMRQLQESVSAPSISYRLESTLLLEASEDRMKMRYVSNGQISTASLHAEPVGPPKS